MPWIKPIHVFADLFKKQIIDWCCTEIKPTQDIGRTGGKFVNHEPQKVQSGSLVKYMEPMSVFIYLFI